VRNAEIVKSAVGHQNPKSKTAAGYAFHDFHRMAQGTLSRH
jgi:hypothetical protein